MFEEAFQHEELLLSDKPGACFSQTERCCVQLLSNRIHRMHRAIMLSSNPKLTHLRQADFVHQRAVLRLTCYHNSLSFYGCCTAPNVSHLALGTDVPTLGRVQICAIGLGLSGY